MKLSTLFPRCVVGNQYSSFSTVTMDTSAFVKQLASNNRKVRENALETLQKYLTTKLFKDAKQLQFTKLWKGLYFAMWFSDRPRPQQRLANQLGELHMLYFDERDNINKENSLTLNDEAFIKFSRAFWKVICMEWFNIDRHRLDKYLLLVRRVIFNQLKYLQSRAWKDVLVNEYIIKVLKWLPLSGGPKIYNGIQLHIVDILLDEWEKLLTSEEEDGEDEQEDQKNIDMAAMIKETPLEMFLEIFSELAADVNNSKVLRNRIKQELLNDERLAQWGITVNIKSTKTETAAEQDEIDLKEDEEEHNGDDDDEEEEVEEWHGF